MKSAKILSHKKQSFPLPRGIEGVSEGRSVHVVFPDGKTRDLEVPTASDWNRLVDILLPHVKPGIILALSGQLGAGKTTFVQALVASLGGAKRPQSPSFSLMRSYQLGASAPIRRLIHVDAYRLEDVSGLLPLDLDEELSDGRSALVMEWPERVEKWILQRAARVIEIQITSGS